MMCVFWTVVAVICLAASVAFAAFFGAIVRWADTQPDDIEDVPADLVRCPRCGHACPVCFGDEDPSTVLQCNECGWIGPPVSVE